MSYLSFHFIFTIPLLVTILLINRKNPQRFSKPTLLGTLTLVILAVTYTTPWDSYLIKEEIWTYEPGKVLLTLYRIPAEEYFFFIIQTLIGCQLTLFTLKKKTTKKIPLSLRNRQKKLFTIELFVFTAIWGITLNGALENSPYRYLNLILAWSAPVLFLQWQLGYKTLLFFKKEIYQSLAILTSYFWIADSFAIWQGIWSFPEGSISGFNLFNILPVEEALFFFVTNCMVVQGFILFTRMDLSNLKPRCVFQ